jgi:DNA-binding IclR family transcriptional regulator
MTRRYQLGLRCLELGYLASSRLALRDYAYPYLEGLLGGNNRIVYLAVPYQDDVLYIEALYPPRRRINYSSQGKRAPMYCTGIGKAALAFLPEAYQQDYLRRVPLKPLTPNTITEPTELRRELACIRKQGYAVDRQERELGIQCVAAPVRAADGRLVAAISISGASTEIAEAAFPALALEVMQAALDISRKLISAGGSSLAL